MKKKQLFKRILSIMLAVCLLAAYALPAGAVGTDAKVSFEKVDNSSVSASMLTPVEAEAEEPGYADTDVVRVSIVLEKDSTIAAGFSTTEIAANADAMSYRAELKQEQSSITRAIEKATGETLDVAWNLTLAANIISANVAYGQIETIEKVRGVKEVVIETRYEPAVVDTDEAADPNMATSSKQIGSAAAWASGYTGAGSKVAIIDTGIDTDHQSFSAEGYEYSLAYNAGLADKSVEEYKAGLNLLTADAVEAVRDELNVSIDPSLTYVSSKIPFAYNYIDEDYDITHDNDGVSEHGSHVTGIAAANAYIKNSDGTYSSAINSVYVQGVAPDAQIVTMKVFGKGGGAYDSDYMAAIEDAIILGCDSVNLSLGSGNPGTTHNATAAYQAILESLEDTDTVVSMSAGNSYSWVENAYNLGYLYADDVSLDTAGSPGSFRNSLGVASVDNDGATGNYVQVGDTVICYTETDYSNEPMTTIAGEQDYIFIDGVGSDEDWAAVGDALTGKIAICSRGTTSFYQKGEAAVNAGAIATIIYNNQSGSINMDLSTYTKTAPCVSITQAEGAAIKAASTPVTDDEGNVLYYTGKMTVGDKAAAVSFDSDYYTMSTFSSWGVPGSLELKPEITAPGGSIYSVNGADTSGTAYETMSGTSMAAPQVTGMAAVIAQYIRETGLAEKTGKSVRFLSQSLLMSTSVPLYEEESGGNYYSILKQGSGLANVGAAITADSYIAMGEDATVSAADGKVKAELGDDPDKTGVYSFSFAINNITDEEKTYALSADFFTQDVFAYYNYYNGSYYYPVSLYMDFWTAPLEAAAVFTVNNQSAASSEGMEGMDFNGDGAVNEKDGQALLDYATGKITEISNSDKADLDNDGDIDSYDAYLFFTRLNYIAVVPANGSVTVTVTIQLTDDQKAALDAYYENGAYIEGFVYAKSASDEEGVAGTTHSIPVLGFYGSWTDPSMYEVGSYLEYEHGEETRIPYLGSTTKNYFGVSYPGDTSVYYFGGNPLVTDSTYMPERNAINSNTTLARAAFVNIRNAADSLFVATNETTGETIKELNAGAVSSAYYYVNGGYWSNTGWTLSTGTSVKSASEGDKVSFSLTLAPEYNVTYDEEGNAVTDWDALGDGATMSISATVDNTAPEIKDVSMSLTGNTMTVVASDNQYVAAVALYNNSGSKVLAACGAAQDVDAGATCAYTMSLDGVNGSKFLVQVYDYAMNVATYKIEVQIGEKEVLPDRIAFDLDGNYWTAFDKTTTYTEITSYCDSDLTFYAATICDHIIFAVTDTGDLYVMPEDDLTDLTLVKNIGMLFTDMAYNAKDGNIYGVYGSDLYTVDKLTGETAYVGTIGVDTNTLACAKDGTFYCNKYSSAEIYSFTLDTIAEPTLLCTTNLPRPSAYVQSMEIDPNTGLLCWCSYYNLYAYYFEIDPSTGEYTRYNDLWDEMSCLIIPEKTSGGGWSKPTDEVSGIEISDTALTVFKGGSKTLSANVLPWTATDRTVSWTSADETVATVDVNGVVTGTGEGVTTITATSNLDATFTAACEVTVVLPENVNLQGAIYDTDSKTYWSEFSTNDLPEWSNVSGESTVNVIGGTLMDETLYVHTGDTLYGIDADTFESESYGTIASSWIWSDAAPAPEIDGMFGRVAALCNNGTYFELINPAEGTLSYWNLSSYYSADPMAVIAYAGSGTYDYQYWFWTYPDCPAHYYYMMTEGGELWKLTIFTYNQGSSYTMVREDLGNTGITLPGVSAVTGGQYASMEYDEETGYLAISKYVDGDTAEMWIVEMTDSGELNSAKTGTFGEKVWPVVSLYQYDRATDLTVKLLTPASVDLYEGDVYQMSVKVKLGETNEVTWSSSDETVATVDSTGKVTAVSEGTATITATSVDVNDAGEHVTASATVNVEGLIDVATSVNAQIVTGSGAEWVTIDTSSMTYSVNGTAATTFTGAGMNDGMIYGTNSDFKASCNIYQVDPSNGFAESQGSGCSTDYAILDMTSSTTGMPMYIANSQWIGFLKDYVGGNLMGWSGMSSYWDKMGALTFAGTSTVYDDDDDATYDCDVYYGLDWTGDLYELDVVPTEDGYRMYFGTVGNVGKTFSSYQTLSMAYDGTGLVIADSFGDVAAIYYVDLTADELAIGKIGNIEGATGISGLYTDSQNTTNNVRIPASIECVAAASEVNAADTAVIDNAPGAATGTNISIRDEFNGEGAPVVFAEDAADEMNSVANADYTEKTASNTGIQADVQTAAKTEQTGATVQLASFSRTRALTPDSAAEVDPDEGTVTVTVTADEAVTNGVVDVTYDADKLTIASVDINGDYTSVVDGDGCLTFGYVSLDGIPAGGTIATVTFTADTENHMVVTVNQTEVNNGTGAEETFEFNCPIAKFTDLGSYADTFHEELDYVVENGILYGTSATTFSPTANTTRAQVISVLYRMAGSPEPQTVADFTDVNPDAYYAAAINWAAENGIACGYGDGTFRPNKDVSREEMVTFLYRFAGYEGKDTTTVGDLSAFTDGDSVSAYAVVPMTWAVENGIIYGTTTTTLDPAGTATRIQLALVAYRYCTNE